MITNIKQLSRKKGLILIYKLSTNKKLTEDEEKIIGLIKEQAPKTFGI